MRYMVETRGSLTAQLRRGVLEYCVLSLLRGGERYGFEVVRSLGEIDGMVTSEGTLYPLLSRLRKERLVQTTWRNSPSGPPRRYYRITSAGEAAFRSFVSEWDRFVTSVNEVLKEGDNNDHP